MSRWNSPSDFDYAEETGNPIRSMERSDPKARTWGDPKAEPLYPVVPPDSQGAAAILDGAFRELASAISDIRQELAESTDPDVLYQLRAQLHDATMELMHLSSAAITKAMELK